MNLVTESVRSWPMRADTPLTLTPRWDRVGERYIFYIISLEPGPGAGHTKEHSLARLAYYPRKKGSERERLSVWKSVKERIPNLPKSSANPVSPCSLILSILDARSWRRLDTAGEALRGREEMLLCTKNLFWGKSSDEGQQLNNGHLLSWRATGTAGWLLKIVNGSKIPRSSCSLVQLNLPYYIYIISYDLCVIQGREWHFFLLFSCLTLCLFILFCFHSFIFSDSS